MQNNKKVYLPAFFKWSSTITDDIIKTLPTVPITDKHASNNKRAIRDHSDDNVTGDTSCFNVNVLDNIVWDVVVDVTRYINTVVAFIIYEFELIYFDDNNLNERKTKNISTLFNYTYLIQ